MEHLAEVPVGDSANWMLVKSSTQVGGDIPRGLEWRFGTSVGHPAQATTLGGGIHQ